LNPITKTDWARVSRSNRCPICDRYHWCTVNSEAGLVRCTKVKSERESIGSDGSASWIHQVSQGLHKFKFNQQFNQQPKPVISIEEISALSKGMFHHPMAESAREREADNLGVPAWTLLNLKVGYGIDQVGEFTSWPIRNFKRQIIGIMRRYRSGKKLTFKGTSNAGLFIPESILPMDTLWIVEGGSDTAAASSIPVSAIGRPSNSGGSRVIAGLLKTMPFVKNVIVWGENDRKADCKMNCGGECPSCWPGKFGANFVATQLKRQVNSKHKKIEIRMPKEGIKDVREMVLTGMSSTLC